MNSLTSQIRARLHYLSEMGVDGLPREWALRLSELLDESKNRRERPSDGRKGMRSGELLKTHFRDEVDGCEKCRLHRGRINIVYGVGDPEARLMFIGEGPGADEDRSGEPFVGSAGKLLDKMINQMGLGRNEIYIGNIVKCRPPQNRNPAEDEIEACLPYLKRQIEIIEPELIVTLGNVATKSLLKTTISISRVRGTFADYCGIPVMPTFHPRYLLGNPEERWLVWDDMVKVLEKLGLAVPKLKKKGR